MAANVPGSASSGNGNGRMTEKERVAQREYWAEHSKKQGSSMENMMLDKSAAKLDLMDRPEVLSLLPPYEGTRILELASGIGRFTGSIAGAAASVVTVEFMEDFLEKNRELNGHFGNVEFICADVLTLALPPASFDLVFSCWIQMYLNDEEVRVLAARTLQWCAPGAHAFFRESCFRQSGDVSRAFNPSHYRHPSFYTKAFSEVRCEDAEGRVWGLELVRSRNLETYVEVKGNKGQICWLWRKVQVPSSSSSSTSTPAAAAVAPPPSSSPPLPATALSNGHNAHSSASAECGGALFRPLAPLSGHDALFGPGFGADRLGGAGPAEALVAALQVARGERVVDWGCGLGGVGLAAAEAHGARAWGVEGRVTLVERAVENAMRHPKAHTVLESCVLERREFEPQTVDAVVIAKPDGTTLPSLPRVAKWLKPGGRVVAGVLGSAAEAEAVRASLAAALGGAADATDVGQPVLAGWLAQALEGAPAARAASSSNGNGAHQQNGNGNGHVVAAPPAGAVGGPRAAVDDAGAEAEAEAARARWSGVLKQVEAGGLSYYVVVGRKR